MSTTKKSRVLEELLQYINTLLVIIIAFIIAFKLGWNGKVNPIQYIMLAGIGVCLITGIVLVVRKTFTWKKAITILLAIGFIMRIGYTLYTPIYIRYHDIGYLSLKGSGHASYILNILRNHYLPTTNHFEFYHPPFFYFVSACVCGILEHVVDFANDSEVLEAAKIVTCTASCWSLLLAPQICYHLKMNRKATAIAVAIVALFPNCYLLAGRVNNDSLYVFFVVLAILYTIKWYQKQTWANTIILALAIGLGMMTKVSAGTIAFFTGPVMLIIFIKRIKQKNWHMLFMKLASFGVIVFPLGLWHCIRQYILFRQPLGYVLRISEKETIYKGYVPFVKRFLEFQSCNLFFPLYVDPQVEYNLNEYVIQTSVFGEFQYQMKETLPKIIADMIPRVLVGVNVILVLISLGAMIYMLVKGKKLNKMLRFGIPALWFVLYAFFIYFNIEYPYGCTMDYRYIVPTAFTGAICIGTLYDQLKTQQNLGARIVRIVSVLSIAVFCIFSVLMYCFIAA